MKEFHFVADCRFSADNIDDAFKKLGEHFLFLEYKEEDLGQCQELEFIGKMEIKPINEVPGA